MTPFRDKEEAHRCPGNDLVALAKQQVDQERDADRESGCAGGQKGTEDCERNHVCGFFGLGFCPRRAATRGGAGTDRAGREPSRGPGVISMTEHERGGNGSAVAVDNSATRGTIPHVQKIGL